jgi:neutral ceramidase
VTLTAGYGEEERIAFNRRFHMMNGTVRFNPGYRNPDIVRAAGPIDPEIGLIEFHSAEGTPIAALVNYALHLDTVGGTKYSADYPFHLSQALREFRGADYLTLFGTGTCGDINHVDVTQTSRRKADEIGTMLAESVRRALSDLKPVEVASLAVKSAAVNAPVQEFSPEEIEAARAGMEHVASSAVPFLERVRNYKIMALQWRGTATIPLEVQAVRLSPRVAVVLLPGEVFVELGMRIKQESPFETTLVIELTNDAPGYIPTRKAFAEGSYETVNSRIQPGYGEKMADTAIRLLKELE